MRQKTIKFAAITIAAFAAGPVWAHPVHVDELAGHSHWLGLAALSIAAIAILALVISGRKRIADKAKAVADKGDAA